MSDAPALQIPAALEAARELHSADEEDFNFVAFVDWKFFDQRTFCRNARALAGSCSSFRRSDGAHR